jgi:hypothetical protein
MEIVYIVVLVIALLVIIGEVVYRYFWKDPKREKIRKIIQMIEN